MRNLLRFFLGLFIVTACAFIFLQARFFYALNKNRQELKAIAANSVLSITADEVFDVPLDRSAESSPGYPLLYRKLSLIKASNPGIKYAYIMAAGSVPGMLKYVADADPVPQVITARSPTALPGDNYDARRFPEMLEAFNGPSADKKINSDEWGTFISGYAPIRDNAGKSVAILGLDREVLFLLAMKKQAGFFGLMAFFIAVSWFILFSLALNNPSKANP